MLRRTFRRLGGGHHHHKAEQKLYDPDPKYAAFHQQNELRQKLLEESYNPSGSTTHNRACAISAAMGFSALIAYKWMFQWTIKGVQL
ncbi:Hypothetical protein, putative [Bodo saltans]|uniref:Uncharacterized protein n=1 Tax=Bodo saltans TaxID=75058 RepID=A0A0S4J0G5_BODSA|nr:Hypothetical protein, putative [Bodo saltans]|eukprot:CUG76602.1 Hypothetical protein, putative [Bodo saltans]